MFRNKSGAGRDLAAKAPRRHAYSIVAGQEVFMKIFVPLLFKR